VLRAANADWGNPRFSPDGQKLAVEIFDGKQRDLWVYDWARDMLTQLTFDPAEDRYPVWTPDGRRLVFASDRGTAFTLNLYLVNADGTGEVTRLTDSPDTQLPASWHPSGKFLAFHARRVGATAADLMILPMEGDAAGGWTPGTPAVFLSTPVNEVVPMFSPDGRWIAYQSDESGPQDVYVRPFPGPGGKWRISATGGATARWSATAHELLFVTANRDTIMAAPYAVIDDSFRAAAAQVWSPTRIQSLSLTIAGYDLHPDGKRVAASVAPEHGSGVQDHVVFVFNFGDYLRTIAPGPK
jgi:serine/threonine-protein kinase